MMEVTVTAREFNEWMRMFIDDPKLFEEEWETVQRFIQEDGDGEPPSYGYSCVAFLKKIQSDIAADEAQYRRR